MLSRHGRDPRGASLSSSFELLTLIRRGEGHGRGEKISDTHRLLRNSRPKRSHTFVQVFCKLVPASCGPRGYTTIRPLDSSSRLRNSLRTA